MAATKDKISDMKPYVERALKDEDLRDNVLAAFTAAREAYDELLGDRGVRGVATRVATDRDVQDNLKTALEELREAADRLQGKGDHKSRNTTLMVAGIALGILMNPVTGPSTRQWIKDKILGPTDEDFTYGTDSTSYGTDSTSGAGTTTGEDTAA